MNITSKFWFGRKPNYGEGKIWIFATPNITFFKDGNWWYVNIAFLFWELTIEKELIDVQ